MSGLINRIKTYRLISALIFIFSGMYSSVSTAETVMITGANAGIGFEFATQYAAKGWDVIAVHRRDTPPASLLELQADYPKIMIEYMDITLLDSVRALGAKLRGQQIDVLLNNAGYGGDFSGPSQALGTLDYDSFETIMRTNGLGALAVTEAFVDNVRASDRGVVVAMSSNLGTFGAGPPYGGGYWYRMSKASLHMVLLTLSKDLKQDGVIVAAINPGVVWSQKNLDHGLIPEDRMVKVDVAVGGLINVIDEMTMEDSGRMVNYKGERGGW
ncbi:MAG TPA: short-chain dehydrogenase [Gammaproteobacteria bacterium]|jgi:NAD(P)-dependent dehydrogenase (short-subunit alcohol dehydrogenase family)|nr:SDR family NAD(P)-dependent oxidoreductase [Pseudomonadota bacterium]HAY44996.1 short-chain dehydrogenase [Gammaproteobacteria bacterium]